VSAREGRRGCKNNEENDVDLSCVAASVRCGICLIVFLFGFLIMNWDYEYLDSPKGTETLIIKHRVATLGESNYFFEFYKKSFHGLLMNKLAAQDLAIMVRDHERYPNAMKALGFDHPNWLSEKNVMFDSKDGRKEIILK